MKFNKKSEDILLMKEDIPELKSVKMLNEKTVEILYNDNVQVIFRTLGEVFREVYKVTEGKRVARLLIIGKNTEITNAARLGIIEENRHNRHLIIAEAVVVNSFYQKISTNFYMKFTKRKYPIQCFTDIESAKEWLAGYVKKDKVK